MNSEKPTYEQLENRILKLEAKLQLSKLDDQENDFFQTTIDLLVEPVFIKDNEHRVIIANSAFYDIFNLTEKDVIGKNLVEAVPEDERKHFLRVDRKVLDTGEPDYREEKLTVGSDSYTILTGKKRYTTNQDEHYLVCSIQNITELRNNEKLLKEQKAKLQKALDEVETLKGIIPICSYCKKIRSDEGFWDQLEEYISKHSKAIFSHGICPDCKADYFDKMLDE